MITSSLRLLLFLVLNFGFAISGFSQDKTARVIEPIWIQAQVVGTLEGHHSLAVIQVTDVDSNNTINLELQSEVLAEFVFGTKPRDGEPKLPGLKAGDLIRVEVDGVFNPSSGQWDYRAFRYRLLKTDQSPSGN